MKPKIFFSGLMIFCSMVFITNSYADWDTTNLLTRCNNGQVEVYYQNQSFQGNVNGWFSVDKLNCNNAPSQIAATCNSGVVMVSDGQGNQYTVANAPCKQITTTPYPQAQIINGGIANPFLMGVSDSVTNNVINNSNSRPQANQQENFQYPQTNNQK